MTRTSKPKADAPAEAVTVEGTKPLYALHEINPYGKGNHAPANSIFVPVSEDERSELLDLEAARELTDDELVVYAARQAATAPATIDSDVIE